MSNSIEFETIFMTYLRAQQTELNMEIYATMNAVWLAETYFYQKIKDLLPEEVERAKKLTKSLEDKIKPIQVEFQGIEADIEALKNAVSKHDFSQTFADRVFSRKEKWEADVSELLKECVNYRNEMVKDILDSGIEK